MIRISFQNSAGELDFREVGTDAEVADAIADMIGTCPSFSDGDKILIAKTDA